MKAMFFKRHFRTKIERLAGTENSGVLIQLNADNQTLNENRRQIKSTFQNYGTLSGRNFIVGCWDSVFINTHGGKELKVAGNPHIAAGFFDQDLQLIKGAFISKAMKQGAVSNDYNYVEYTVRKQNFVWEARYQSEQSTDMFFFEQANKTRKSLTPYNNMRNENPTVNAGGGFYLLSIKVPPNFDLFQARVKKYTENHENYYRLNDNCAHALLESLSIPIPFRYGLDTQTAFGLVMKYFGLSHPITLVDCLKDPITLGWEESIKLQNIHASSNKILLDDAKNRLGIT